MAVARILIWNLYDSKTSMLFGDAKKSLTGLVSEVKNV